MHKIICLVSESGGGKDSIASKLAQCGYKVLRSYSTRPRRDGEGDTHIFIDKSEVEQYRSDMIAWTQIADYEYFSTHQQLLDSDIYIIDPEGIKFLKKKAKDVKVVSIYIKVDESTRRKRALQRHDKEEDIIKRFLAEYDQFHAFKSKAMYNYAVENYDLDKAFAIVKYIVERELKDEA